jgi:hypothetical protein
MVRYSLGQSVFLDDTYIKYESARKFQQNVWRKFWDERVPSRQAIHNAMIYIPSFVKVGLGIQKLMGGGGGGLNKTHRQEGDFIKSK